MGIAIPVRRTLSSIRPFASVAPDAKWHPLKALPLVAARKPDLAHGEFRAAGQACRSAASLCRRDVRHLDGVDAVIAEFPASPGNAFAMLGVTHITFPSALRDELLALQSAGNDEIARAARAANALADLYAKAIADACDACGVAPHDLVAAGVHGQTVRHLRNRADFADQQPRACRGACVRHGGRGFPQPRRGRGGRAPLVPAFTRRCSVTEIHRVVVNIGGIANITDLPSRGTVSGFDTGRETS
jgi:anhydro-N-acetylmuramic acid kinase